jgi:basic membrane protein A
LASGEYHAFTGPINKQDGTPWLAMGETASDYGDDGLAGLNFYVEGITAEVPQ